MTLEELSKFIEEIADRIENRDDSYDLQVMFSEATMELMHIENWDELKRLGHVDYLYSMHYLKNSPTSSRYESLQKKNDKLPPFDPNKNSEILRSIAEKIRK